MVVEIDESLFQGKRKYNVGRVMPDRPWVFGAIDRISKKVSLAVVTDRTRATLEHEIQRCISPGFAIYSDQWAAYGQLQ